MDMGEALNTNAELMTVGISNGEFSLRQPNSPALVLCYKLTYSLLLPARAGCSRVWADSWLYWIVHLFSDYIYLSYRDKLEMGWVSGGVVVLGRCPIYGQCSAGNSALLFG